MIIIKDIIKFIVAKDIPNNAKETSLQETEMSSREFNSFFLSTILRFSPLQPSKPENKPCSTPISVSYTHLTLPTIYSV